MNKNHTVYYGQIFVKMLPIDNGEKIKAAKKYIAAAKDGVNRCKALMKGQLRRDGFVRNDVLSFYSYHRALLYKYEKDLRLLEEDSAPRFQFWTLSGSSKESMAVIPNSDPVVLTSVNPLDEEKQYTCTFKNIDDIFKEFVPLDKILSDGEFIGKKIDQPSFFPSYVLYRYGNLVITCSIVDKKIDLVYPGVCNDVELLDSMLEGPSREKLNVPTKVKKAVYRFQNENQRQID